MTLEGLGYEENKFWSPVEGAIQYTNYNSKKNIILYKNTFKVLLNGFFTTDITTLELKAIIDKYKELGWL